MLCWSRQPPVSCSSHLLTLGSCINITPHFLCPLLSCYRPNFTLINKMLLTHHQCSSRYRTKTTYILHHSAADYLDLVKELGKRWVSLTAINLQTILHFICLFDTFRTVLLRKACQILVTFIADAHSACISSVSMDFQYLFYILPVFTIMLVFHHHLK